MHLDTNPNDMATIKNNHQCKLSNFESTLNLSIQNIYQNYDVRYMKGEIELMQYKRPKYTFHQIQKAPFKSNWTVMKRESEYQFSIILMRAAVSSYLCVDVDIYFKCKFELCMMQGYRNCFWIDSSLLVQIQMRTFIF